MTTQRNPFTRSLPYVEEMVPIDLFRVDETYQRPLAQKHVARLLPYSLSRGGSMLGNRRDDDPRFIYEIDGQHRIDAARQEGFGYLPVRVLHVTRQKEAYYFVQCNWTALLLSPADRFRALLVAEDERACAIRDVVEMCDYRIAYENRDLKPDVITAIDALYVLTKPRARTDKYDMRLLEKTLVLCACCWPHQQHNGDGRLLLAVAHVLRRAPELDRERFADKMSVLPPRRWIVRGVNVGKDEGSTASVGLAQAMVEEYNSRLPRDSRRRLPDMR